VCGYFSQRDPIERKAFSRDPRFLQLADQTRLKQSPLGLRKLAERLGSAGGEFGRQRLKSEAFGDGDARIRELLGIRPQAERL